MKPGIPWSVKGVEPELREIAKTAARRSGMTLGEWLNSAINEQADGDEPEAVFEKAPSLPRSRISTHPIERAATRLEDIAEQLSRLARRDSETASHVMAPPAEDTQVIGRVLSRIESNERQTVEAFSAVNERLAMLSRQFAKAQTPPAPRPEDTPGFQTLEKAVRNIVEHLEVSDKRTRENLKSLQERMADMTTRVSSTTSEQLLRQAPVFSQLENRLSELGRRIDQSQAATQNALPDVLRHELDGLASRIETVHTTAEALAGRAQTQAVQAAQGELRAIEQRILGLLHEAQAAMAKNATGPQEIHHFRTEIEKLNARIDEAAKSTREVSTLRQTVEQLSTRVAQGQDARPFAEIDKRILDISKRLDQTQAAAGSVPQFGELDRRIAELDHRLNEAMHLQQQAGGNDQLEQKLAEVSDRLGRTEHQLSHLETIERAISQLYDTIEQGRNWTREVADDAANRMGQHIISQQQAQPQALMSLETSPEIMALQQGLQAVREATHTSDQRNQETLEAVHETLEQIVNKLSELETAAIGQRVMQAAGPAPQASFEAPPAEANPFIPQTDFEDPEPTFSMMDEAKPEPQLAPPVTQNPNPFDAVAGSQRPVEAFTGNEDIIAAARRLARAANQQKASTSLGAPTGKAPKSGKIGGGFTLPFLKPRKTDGPMPAAAAAAQPIAANANDAAKKRRLILMGLTLLAMVSSVVSYSYLGRTHAPVQATPAAMTQPETPPIAAPSEPTPPAAQLPDQSPGVAPDAAAPVPAPMVNPEKKPPSAPTQQGSLEEGGTDPILTGALPAAMAVQPVPVVIDEAAGSLALRQAALKGDANAQFIVATHYLNGDTVPMDMAKAAYWYGKAAVAGSAPAQYRVATLYERGKGVSKDMAAALQWYERAAAMGNVKAMHNAAVIAAGNEAGKADYAKAYKWFALASDHGLKDSQYNLAVLIERGLGTQADTTEALFWYMAAAAQGDKDSQTRVDQLTKSLSPATVDSAKTRLAGWKPSSAPEAANSVAPDDAKSPTAAVQTAAAAPLGMIENAQNLLEKLGYNIGTHDGKLGGRTTNAIRLFQLQQGLKVTGELSPDLITAMQAKVG